MHNVYTVHSLENGSINVLLHCHMLNHEKRDTLIKIYAI